MYSANLGYTVRELLRCDVERQKANMCRRNSPVGVFKTLCSTGWKMTLKNIGSRLSPALGPLQASQSKKKSEKSSMVCRYSNGDDTRDTLCWGWVYLVRVEQAQGDKFCQQERSSADAGNLSHQPLHPLDPRVTLVKEEAQLHRWAPLIYPASPGQVSRPLLQPSHLQGYQVPCHRFHAVPLTCETARSPILLEVKTDSQLHLGLKACWYGRCKMLDWEWRGRGRGFKKLASECSFSIFSPRQYSTNTQRCTRDYHQWWTPYAVKVCVRGCTVRGYALSLKRGRPIISPTALRPHPRPKWPPTSQQ